MSDVNPYAPPATDESSAAPARRTRGKKGGRKDIQAALDALDEHLADPQNVASDLKASGGRLRTITIVMLALGAGAIVIGLAMSGDSRQLGLIIGASIGAVFLLIGAIAVGMDLSLVSRAAPGAPTATLKSWLRGFTLGRYGYTWAMLSPTARGQTVNAPDLAPVPTGLGSFTMDREESVKAYAATFGRPGNGHMRNIQIKNVTLVREDDRVAVAQATMVFAAWPQWANIMIGVGAAFGGRVGSGSNAPLGMIGLVVAVIGLIGLLALRKRRTVIIQKTLLRAENGVWYMFDADILEGVTSDE
jgi:hypothetical protein